MAKTHQHVTVARKPVRRKSNADRVVKTIAEERSQRDRRLVRLVTQHMVKRSGVRQHSISQLEERTDMLLIALRGHVRKMGGELVVTVQFPGREPMRLTAFADIARAGRGKSQRKRGRSPSG